MAENIELSEAQKSKNLILQRTLNLVMEGHQDQVDLGGELIILHILRIFSRATTFSEQLVSLLHDLVEDTEYTYGELYALGYSDEVVCAVEALTRNPTETYSQYIDRVIQNPLACAVKLLDLEDNMDLKRVPLERVSDWERKDSRLSRYVKARERVIQALETHKRGGQGS